MGERSDYVKQKLNKVFYETTPVKCGTPREEKSKKCGAAGKCGTPGEKKSENTEQPEKRKVHPHSWVKINKQRSSSQREMQTFSKQQRCNSN